MTTPNKASLTRVHDRLFGHRRYGSAIHGPATSKADNHGAEQFRAAPYQGKSL